MSSRPALRLVLLLAALALPVQLVAQDTTPAPKPVKIRRNPELISQEEIEAAGDVHDAYDLVQRLRATWLPSRGGGLPQRGQARRSRGAPGNRGEGDQGAEAPARHRRDPALRHGPRERRDPGHQQVTRGYFFFMLS